MEGRLEVIGDPSNPATLLGADGITYENEWTLVVREIQWSILAPLLKISLTSY